MATFSPDLFRGLPVRHEWSEKDMTFVRHVVSPSYDQGEQTVTSARSRCAPSFPPLWLINMVEGSRVVPETYPVPVHADGCTEWACLAHGHQLVTVHIQPVCFNFIAGSFSRQQFRRLQTSIRAVPRCVGPVPPVLEKTVVRAINASSASAMIATAATTTLSQPFHEHSSDIAAVNGHCRKKNQYFHSIHKRKYHDTQARSKPKNSHRKTRERSRLMEANAAAVNDPDPDTSGGCEVDDRSSRYDDRYDDRDDDRDYAWESFMERQYQRQYWEDYDRRILHE